MKTSDVKVEAVIVDWAGTTVDFGSCAPVAAFQQTFRLKGVEITEQEAREPMGRGKRDHIQAIARQPRVANAWEQTHSRPVSEADVDAMFVEFVPLQEQAIRQHSDVLPGVTSTMQWLLAQNIPVGSTTGYTRHLMNILEPLAAEQGFTPANVVCIDDVSAGRPAPWMLLRSAERLQATTIPAIVAVDDTVVGIEAARRAGAVSIGVSGTGNALGMSLASWQALSSTEQAEALARARQLLGESGADFVLNSIAELPDCFEAIIELIQRRLATFRA